MSIIVVVLIVHALIGCDCANTCPSPTSKGSMSKAMECGKKLGSHMDEICKKKLTDEIANSIKAECLEKHIVPCIPPDLNSMVQECVYQNDIISAKNFCNKQVQDKVAECAKKILNDNEKKQKLLKLFKQKMGLVCEQCNKFATCVGEHVKRLK